MSIRRLPRQMGIWIVCDGTTSDPHPKADFNHCPSKVFTANIRVDINRQAAAKDGWGRGLRKDRKRSDHCPTCLLKEKAIEATRKAQREADKRASDAARKAQRAGSPSPKKSRKSRSASPSPSPSAERAPAPAI